MLHCANDSPTLAVLLHQAIPTPRTDESVVFPATDHAAHVCQSAQERAAEKCCRAEFTQKLIVKEFIQDMRPKKVILCVDDNEQELSVLKFMLATNGYRVLSALNGQEAIGIFAESTVDLVLSDFAMPQMNGSQLVDRLKEIAPHVPMILLGDPQKMGGDLHAADAMLAKKNCSPQELLERIKVMSARKRGPRKGSVRTTHVQDLARELAVAS